jgi:diguanylate cyclase (GGDEF)-like protein
MAKSKTVVTVISKIADRPIDCDAALVVICGPELGRKYDLRTFPVVIGRATSADVQVDQESISRQHAELRSEGDQVILADLGSTNGTFVNDERVETPYMLKNGDLLKIGRTIFKFIGGRNIEAQYHEEIYRLTTVDGLTQISNRRFFEDAIEREVSRCHRYGRHLSLVMIDLDRFKDVNDNFGHLAGDQVLKRVAQTLKEHIRREDTLARWGGEEFALLLPELPGPSARQVAEKLRRLISDQRMGVGKKIVEITLSLGVSSLGEQLTDAADLIRAADDKLYEAKALGRNRVCA